MHDAFFYFCAFLTILAALLVVTNRNAVNAAMFLIVTFLGVASLFVLLESYFLAVIQVLVYAGAVVVLFLFIIMLLDVKGGERATIKPLTWVAGVVAIGLLLLGVGWVVLSAGLPEPAASSPGVGSSLKGFGYILFTTYLLPMQLTGFLLLVAMIGVIVLSKRVGDRDRDTSGGKGTEA